MTYFKSWWIASILTGLILAGCGPAPMAPAVRELTELEKSLVESSGTFGIKLFKEVSRSEGTKNIFISPLSVSMALGMTLNGANGETRTAMQQTLALSGLTTEEINQAYQTLIELLTTLDPETAFQIANSIWHRNDRTFEPAFLETNQTFFDAVVRALDFDDPQSVGLINDWVKDNTNGKIEKIIETIDPSIVMFLINAIYFNGSWTYEFDKEQTHDDRFTLPSGSQTDVRMMVQTNEFRYHENDDFQAIDLPYGAKHFSMTVFLPRLGKTVDSLIEQLSNQTWQDWLTSLAADSVILELPKFKLEYDIKLNDILAALGMGLAFSGAADFTRMYGPGGLFIDYVKHKTFVEVDEEGTEAAAVTVVAIAESAGGPQPYPYKYMRVDRPFIFAIRDNVTGAILFIGQIVEPASE